MAATRSRLHTILQSCTRCSRSSLGHSTGLDKLLHIDRRPQLFLLHRLHGSTGQPTCQSCLRHHHHHGRWQCRELRALSRRAYHTTPSWCHLQSSTAVQDPYHLVQAEMATLCDSIRKELGVDQGDLGTIVRYYFDGTGKAFRPMVVMLMAKACNVHQRAEDKLLQSQQRIGMITEMLHTATLIHDDVIDASDARRGKDSINYVWGQRKAILSGNYILSAVSTILARIGNPDVVSIMSQVVEDLVRGEFMQLGSKEEENERFAHYLDKTFKKTASMLAASCQSLPLKAVFATGPAGKTGTTQSSFIHSMDASLRVLLRLPDPTLQVAVLGGCHDDLSDMAYSYGRNLGIAFQLVDDLLDFVSSEQQMGKPTAADLKLGLATAPVLFAAQEFPELTPLIMRRFSQEGDVETARRLVAKSEGIEQTKLLAAKHTQEAVRLLHGLTSSTMQRALVALTQQLLTRQK